MESEVNIFTEDEPQFRRRPHKSISNFTVGFTSLKFGHFGLRPRPFTVGIGSTLGVKQIVWSDSYCGETLDSF